jgi:hypothetical protein
MILNVITGFRDLEGGNNNPSQHLLRLRKIISVRIVYNQPEIITGYLWNANMKHYSYICLVMRKGYHSVIKYPF